MSYSFPPSPLHPQSKSAAPPPPPVSQQSWSPPVPSRKEKDATMDVSPVSSDNEEDMNVRKKQGGVCLLACLFVCLFHNDIVTTLMCQFPMYMQIRILEFLLATSFCTVLSYSAGILCEFHDEIRTYILCTCVLYILCQKCIFCLYSVWCMHVCQVQVLW